ncbi:unnamed protein product, partial [Ectocarpus sp. 8 AP-2014]
RSCCCFPISVSKIPCSFMSHHTYFLYGTRYVCTWLQSIPREVIPSAICLDFTAESSVMGDRPEFSARAMGTSSKASAKLRTAYC